MSAGHATTGLAVSAAVVCYNEAHRIAECIESLLAQDFAEDAYEILIVDNASNDATTSVVEAYAQRDSRVRLANNPTPGIAASRNVALHAAQAPLVAFTDADCRPPRDWLATLYRGYRRHHDQDARVAAVGGANIPPPDISRFYDAAAITLDTFWGNHGSAQGKIYREDAGIDHIPTANILYEKASVLAVGGFDEAFGNVCEDPDLNFRLCRAGHSIVFLAGCYVHHHMRDSYRQWARNIFTYGKGNIWLIKKHPARFHVMYLAPPLFVLLLPAALWIYLPVNLGMSLWALQRKGRPELLGPVFLIYAVNHLFFGIGEWYGLFTRRKPPQRATAAPQEE